MSDRALSYKLTISQEVFTYLGLPDNRPVRGLFQAFFNLPAHRFAGIVEDFEDQVNQYGFQQAAGWVLPQFVRGLRVDGAEYIPASGPLLLAANHPGNLDSLAIAAILPRDDLKIIARAGSFVRCLNSSSSHLIYSSRDAHVKMSATRAALRHLAEGGALLVFPSGTMDPDPSCMNGSSEALVSWSSSLEMFLRKVPGVQIQVVILSGFLAPDCLRHPLARTRRGFREQQIVAEIVQMVNQIYRDKDYQLCPKVSFSSPARWMDIDPTGSGVVMRKIIEIAHLLLQHHAGSEVDRSDLNR